MATFLLAFRILSASEYFVIRAVDEQTGRGIPMVEFCTTSNVCHWTDSNGVIALDEPGYRNRRVYFRIFTYGYEAEKKGLDVKPGVSAIVKLRRTQIAERLYRVTGEGIFRDSILAGISVPPGEPLLNAEVTGLDTVMYAPYRGRIFWVFGDTNKLSGALGHFATTAATSNLPVDPETFIDLNYFPRADGFTKPVAAAIPGEGLKWLHTLMTLRDSSGTERLIAHYSRVKTLNELLDTGLAVFNDDKREFTPLVSFGPKPKLTPHGRPVRAKMGGVEYLYFSWPRATPVVRVRADWNAVRDLTRYEALECGAGGCIWKNGGDPTTLRFHDADTLETFDGRLTSMYWNDYRRRWIAIIQRRVDEVWLAECDTPTGPWAYARRIIEHHNYSFYWPGHIPYLDGREGRRIYIMGTYTQMFSKAPAKTPRYDYNQLVYAVSLDDERMFLPVAHYKVRAQTAPLRKAEIDARNLWSDVESVAYYDYEPDRRPKSGKRLPAPPGPVAFERNSEPVK
ncbi:MAG: hypothetical protein HYZ37_17265 [Candidatus Solibacter usitatus]|nr:hypothetical protein [Candidatus Solibacter usitatus]